MVTAVEQLNGLGKLHLQQVVAQRQQENDAEQSQRLDNGGKGNHKSDGQFHTQHNPQKPKHGPGKQDAQPNPQGQGQHCYQQGFPEEDVGDVPLFHAQDVVKADLLFPALHDEAVGVKQEQYGKQPDDKHAQSHHGRCGGTTVHGLFVDALAQRGNGVEHDDDPQAGKQVGQVDTPVAAQVGAGQLPVEAKSPVTHGRPRSFPGGWQAGSKCGKWPGTSRRRSWRPGRSDGTPGRL